MFYLFLGKIRSSTTTDHKGKGITEHLYGTF